MYDKPVLCRIDMSRSSMRNVLHTCAISLVQKGDSVIYLFSKRNQTEMWSFGITMTSYWAWWRLTHQPHDCLLNRLFKAQIKETSKLRVTGLCAGNSPVTGEFPAQRVSNAENVFIWWRHHDLYPIWPIILTQIPLPCRWRQPHCYWSLRHRLFPILHGKILPGDQTTGWGHPPAWTLQDKTPFANMVWLKSQHG